MTAALEEASGTAPLVSIITPVFNAEAFVEETIASVQAQSLQDWEMLIADDASVDHTVELVESVTARDERVRLLRLAENGGVARARNACLAEAKGRYIAFLDSDDLWLPQKLERQIAFMAERDAAVSYSAFRRIDEDGRQIGRLVSVPAELSYRQLLKNTAIATLTGMVDTAKTGPIQMKEARRDDFILWLSLLKRGFIAYGLQEDLARYRVVSGSLSSKPKRSAAWVWAVYRDTEKLNPIYAAWCLANYGARAVLKRLAF